MSSAPSTPRRAPGKRRPPTRKRDKDDASRLGKTQWRAIELELQGVHPSEIQAQCQVSKSQWYRWHDAAEYPHFVRELARARRDGLAVVADLMAAQQREMVDALMASVRVLRLLTEDEELPPRDRIRAAAECGRLCKDGLATARGLQLPATDEVETPKDDGAQGVARVYAAMHQLAALDPKALEPDG